MTPTVDPPLPRPSVESEPFWAAVQKDELRFQRCARDGKLFFPPAARCPRCWSREWSWDRVSGRGTVFSFVTFQRSYHPAFRASLPYVVAIVEIEEGARFTTRLTDVRVEDVRVGMAVEVSFTPVAGGAKIPLFRPAGPMP
ncbi:MAG: OB-fold domain-containing protein [Chloroflexota bacterium]|nr:OB-fold domain-containing protein [Chloroflexota bacterium]MDE3193120.1 OB-fold domain-containing protein [Chloroflexota bacterium]